MADELHPDQVQECGIDHWYDAATYGLASRHSDGGVPDPPEAKPTSARAVLGLDEVLEGDLEGRNESAV